MDNARFDALVSQARTVRRAELEVLNPELVGPPKPVPPLAFPKTMLSPDLRCWGRCGTKVCGLSHYCTTCQGDDPHELMRQRGA